MPKNNIHQRIIDLKVISPFKYSIMTEKKYGNKMVFISVPNPPANLDVGRGNCTDYHSYFIGLCRNIGIPAYFETGLLIPPETDEGKIRGYQCWSYFWDGSQWIPVDISEADRNPVLKKFFFGNLRENRIAFSAGRDIILYPQQKNAPLNFFVDPYAEVDGRTHESVSKEFYFKAKKCKNL